MEVGEYIKTLRQNKGLTLEQVGNAVGVGKSTVRKWEVGNIKNMGRDKVAKLAIVLGTTPDLIIQCEEMENTSLRVCDSEEKPSTVSALTDEERMLIYCWRQATPEIRENVAFALRSYGMPKPKAEEEDYSTSAGA